MKVFSRNQILCDTYPYITDPDQIKQILTVPDIYGKITLLYTINSDGSLSVPKQSGLFFLHEQMIDKDGHLKIKFKNCDCGFKYTNSAKLKSLEGFPQIVDGDFDIRHTTKLKSLKGGPQIVSGSFCVDECPKLLSLEGCPKSVGKDFYCNDCKSLLSFENCPQTVARDFICYECPNADLTKHFPKYIGRDLYCDSYENIDILKDIVHGKIITQ